MAREAANALQRTAQALAAVAGMGILLGLGLCATGASNGDFNRFLLTGAIALAVSVPLFLLALGLYAAGSVMGSKRP